MNSAAGTLARRAFALFALAFCFSGAGAALAQTSPTAPPLQGNSYQGAVASIDSSKNSFVINTTFGQRTLTVETTDTTKITKSTNVGLAGLKTGDQVSVIGQVDATALTVAARRITIQHGTNAAAGARAVGRRAIRGKVATTSPTLTITGEDGKTYTVQPANSNIQVLAPAPAAFSDILVGGNVTVHGSADSTADTLTAKSVEIRPQGRGGRGGRRRQQQPPAQ